MAFFPFIRRAVSAKLLSQSHCSVFKSLLHRFSPASSPHSFHSRGELASYMRAAMFTDPNKPLTIEEFNMPRPKAGEVLIKVKACGVCHSDLHVMKGELPFPSPCVVGHEITGEVVEHGPLTDNFQLELMLSEHSSCLVETVPAVQSLITELGKGHDDLCEDFFAYNRAKGTLYDGETRLFLRRD
ncbi:hypothetical protein SDJN02_11693, partial [Cucurbita argyrosperma subsp. argyrosperma]